MNEQNSRVKFIEVLVLENLDPHWTHTVRMCKILNRIGGLTTVTHKEFVYSASYH